MELIKEIIAKKLNAPIILLFGGNPERRHEVLTELAQIGEVNIYGTLSEEEGIAKLLELSKVDVVLIGGRYDETQRKRIRELVSKTYPAAKLSEPGWHYKYDNELIRKDIALKLNLPYLNPTN